MSVPTLQEVRESCPPPLGEEEKLVDQQTSKQILAAISNAIVESPYVKNFAYIFEEGNDTVEQTCADLYDFMHDNFNFDPEPAKRQTERTVSVIVYDTSSVDCKHFSTFALSCLQALGIESSLRICKYPNKKSFTHVYVVAWDEEGNEIIVDGTLNSYNVESEAEDYKTLNYKKMALYKLSGEEALGKWSLKNLVKGVEKAASDVEHDVSNVVKSVEHAVAVVGIAPARLAALALISSDDLGLAKSLLAAYKTNPQKIKDFWTGLGGDWPHLRDAINKGASANISGQTIGDVTVSQAQANPIVTAIVNVLATMGIGIPPVVVNLVNNFLNKSKKVLAETANIATQALKVGVDGQTAQAGVYKPKGGGEPGDFPLVPILVVGGLVVGAFILANN